MITTTVELDLYLVNGTHKFDHIKRLIALVRDYIVIIVIITISGFYCTCVLGGSASPASSATMKVRMDWKKRAMKVLNPKTKP